LHACLPWLEKHNTRICTLPHTLLLHFTEFKSIHQKDTRATGDGKKSRKLIIKMENEESPINLTLLFLSLTNLESLYFASHDNAVATLEEHIHYPFHTHIKHLHLGSQDFGPLFMSSKYPNLKSLVVSHDVVS
jgi:hypothetical protein